MSMFNANLLNIRHLMRDPRHYQIVILSALLILGITHFKFSVSLWGSVVIFLSAIVTQVIFEYFVLKKTLLQTDLRSPIITALSLTLLLRANTADILSAWPLAVAAMVAISSKFLLRLQGKHIFNPANIGIVFAILVTGAAWTTPGQWGPLLWLAFLMSGIGFFVTYKAARADVPILFLGTYIALIFLRALWLGDPLTIPLLNLQSGALLLFAFFMISDPKTTPDSFIGRMIFCSGVAALAYLMQYHLYIRNGLFYALALGCLLRPAIDYLFPRKVYVWPKPPKISDPVLAE
ncbi:MAG: RnfABCDGE type electron transport complex subunit D [bacterium]